MAKRIQVGGRIESMEVGGIVTGAAEILDDAKGKKQSVINQETDTELGRLDQSKQDNLTFDNAPTEGSDNPVKSGGLYTAQQAILLAIAAIYELIPSAASVLNQLADKAFVNSSISTNTATFRGTSAAGLNEQQFLAWANGLEHDLNDYVFWQTSDAAGNILFKRYKWNGTEWAYEYTLNNSTFTAEQWEAIQSGITALLVAKLRALPTAEQLIQSFDSKQDALTFDDVPTLGSTNPVKSSGIYNVIKAITDLMPAEATAQNQLADKADVAAKIVAAIPSWKGQYDALTDLQAVTGAKAGDMGCVKTTDSDGHAVLTFYQYSAQGAWVEYYTLRHYAQNKPATTGTTGDYSYNGMVRIELQKNIVNGVNTLTQAMLTQQNTIYVIQYDFTLASNITVPANCVLEFDGGSVSGGFLISNNTRFAGNFNPENIIGLMYSQNGELLDYNGNNNLGFYIKPLFGEYINNYNYYVSSTTGATQAVVTTKDNIFLLFGGTKTKIFVYDYNFNLLGWTLISDNNSHSNGATICDGYIYAARTQSGNNGCIKVSIANVLTNAENHTDTNSEIVFSQFGIVTGIDYDEYTNTFALCRGSSKIIQISKNGEVLTDLTSQVGSIMSQSVGDNAVIQDVLFIKGYLYVSVWLGAESGDNYALRHTSAVILYDYITNQVLDVSYIEIDAPSFEIEGICKCDGEIYINYNIHYITDQQVQFGIAKLERNIYKTERPSFSSFGSLGIPYIIVDNSYKGKSYGTKTKPFKTLGEALAMTANMPYVDCELIYTGEPYYMAYNRLNGKSFYLHGSGTDKVVIDGYWDLMMSNVRLSNVELINTYAIGAAYVISSSFSKLTFDGTAVIHLNNSSMIRCVDIKQSDVYINNLTLKADSDLYDDTPTVSNTPNLIGFDIKGVSNVYIENYLYIDRLTAFNVSISANANITINHQSGVIPTKGWLIKNSNNGIHCKYQHFIMSLNDLNDIITNIMAISTNYGVEIHTLANITLSDGSVLPKGRYTNYWINDVVGLMSLLDHGHLLTNGIRGTTLARNGMTIGLEAGAFYFDQDLNKPVWRNKNNNGWVDATGNPV